MPIYEFYCRDNHKIYSFFARSLAYANRTPRCPENPAWHMEKLVSNFAVIGKAKEPGADPAGSDDDLDDPRMAAAMEQIEREMGGMAEGLDSENPDPRQLAHLMRRLSALTGEKVPKDMEQMLRRMEAGESLEKLDEEYADADFPAEDGSTGGESGKEAALMERLRSFRKLTSPPERVSRLYEMREFVE